MSIKPKVLSLIYTVIPLPFTALTNLTTAFIPFTNLPLELVWMIEN